MDETSKPGSPLEKGSAVVLMLLGLALPLTISVAEGAAFLIIVLAGILIIKDKRWCEVHRPLCIIILAYALLAGFSVFWSIRPSKTVERFHRLVLFFLPFAVGVSGSVMLGRGLRSRLGAVICFLVATSLLAVFDLFRVSLVYAGKGNILESGNMRDPQFYMVSLCFLAALGARPGALRFGIPVTALLQCAAFILHFKRGTWIAGGVSQLLVAGWKKRIRALIWVVLCGAVIFSWPTTRERVLQLKDTVLEKEGGRYILWTRVAPEFYREAPHGVGFNALRFEDLKNQYYNVQLNLDHLHSNPIQIRAELGWPGLVLWLTWMFMGLGLLYRSYRRSLESDPDQAWIFLGALGGLCALLLNGLVEYNFGDTEILLLFGLLIGLADVPADKRHTMN